MGQSLGAIKNVLGNLMGTHWEQGEKQKNPTLPHTSTPLSNNIIFLSAKSQRSYGEYFSYINNLDSPCCAKKVCVSAFGGFDHYAREDTIVNTF